MDAKVTRRLKQGDVLVLGQSSKQRQFIAKKPGMVFRYFSLAMEQLYPLFDVCELSLIENVVEDFGGLKVYPAASTQALECQRLLQSIPSEPSLDQRAQALGIVARILSEEFKRARTRRPGFVRAEEHMEHVFERLSESEFLSLSVPELASRFGCSRRHLTRLFHQYFGSSIADLRLELRLLKAASLLRSPNMKIIHVAEHCAFNQLGYFNACFKRRFGVSPGQWRKQAPGGMVTVSDNGGGGQSAAVIFKGGHVVTNNQPRPSRSCASTLLDAGENKPGLEGARPVVAEQQAELVSQSNCASKKSFELIGSIES